MKQTFLTAISGFALLLVILMVGCQKEDGLSPAQDNKQITVRSHDCDDPFTCWDVNDQDKYAHTSTVSNNSGPQTRVFTFTYYNTLSNFHVDWSYVASNNASRYLKLTVSGNGVVDASHSTLIVQSLGAGSHDFALEAGWDLCYDVDYVAEIWEPIAPAGPENDVLLASTSGSYDLVDECTCDDGRQNQGEEGIDCGGPCPPCVTGCDDSFTAECSDDGCGENTLTFTYVAGEDGPIVIQGGLNANAVICSVASSEGTVIPWGNPNDASVRRLALTDVEECDEVTVTISWDGPGNTGSWSAKRDGVAVGGDLEDGYLSEQDCSDPE